MSLSPRQRNWAIVGLCALMLTILTLRTDVYSRAAWGGIWVLVGIAAAVMVGVRSSIRKSANDPGLDAAKRQKEADLLPTAIGCTAFLGYAFLALTVPAVITMATAQPEPTQAPSAPATSRPRSVAFLNRDAATSDAEAPETPLPTPSVKERKREFIAGVDESITGQRIAGNPFKFVGQDVDLHGEVASVVDEQHFNLSTGGIGVDDDGNVSNTLGIVVVECQSTHDLEEHQRIRVLGTVMAPIDGTNAMGGARQFGAVHAEFME